MVTVDSIDLLCINCTVVELKHTVLSGVGQAWNSINCTVVELKRSYAKALGSQSGRINCTVVELKLV